MPPVGEAELAATRDGGERERGRSRRTARDAAYFKARGWREIPDVEKEQIIEWLARNPGRSCHDAAIRFNIGQSAAERLGKERWRVARALSQ